DPAHGNRHLFDRGGPAMTAIHKRKQSALSKFSRAEKRGLYKAIYKRRDVRGHFLPDPVSDRLLRKLLDSAHHAGSVGFMQPWSFIVIRSPDVKRQVKDLFEHANAAAAKVFEDQKRELYSKLKLEGILEAPINLCVTCDPSRNGPHVLGRNTIRETDDAEIDRRFQDAFELQLRVQLAFLDLENLGSSCIGVIE